MNKKQIRIVGVLLVLVLLILFSIEESRSFILALVLRIFFFAKKYFIEIVTAFFLVKGKFIVLAFAKKIALISATGLSKRYLIEKVINHNLKIHFLDHITDDVKKLLAYIKTNFKDFPIVKQLIASLTFIASLSFVGKFMGGMLAMKVFIAKFWSFILAIVLKFSTTILYFFTDYLWGSWIAPIVEVLIFSWLLEWLEKIPFLKKYIVKIYDTFIDFFMWIEGYMEKIFHIPAKRFFRFLAKKIQTSIYKFMGYSKVSAWKHLREMRMLHLNSTQKLKAKRKGHKEKRKIKGYVSASKKLRLKREEKKKH